MWTRWPPWTRMRIVPSGTLIMRAIAPTTPTSNRSSGLGTSLSGLREATMTSMRLPRRTSSTSATERSWPTASGISVSGSGIVSRSGRTGGVRGRVRGAPTSTSCSSPAASAISMGAAISGLLATFRGGPLTLQDVLVAVDLDRHRARAALGTHERKLDAQHAVAVGGPCGVGDDVGPELDHAPEGAEVDLELLIDAALGVGRPAVAGEHELAPVDLQRELVGIDPGQLGLDDRARWIALVEDIDRRREAAALARSQPSAVEHVPEELVHLAAHALEVGEEVSLGRHRLRVRQ